MTQHLLDSHLQTLEGQKEHYAKVRARLWRIGFNAASPQPAVRPVTELASSAKPQPIRPQLVPEAQPIMAVPGKRAIKAQISVEEAALIRAYRETGSIRKQTTEDICKEVCQAYGITRLDLISARRSSPFPQARHEAYFRMRHETAMSLPAIGRRFGNRDHTTVLHGVRKVTGMLAKGWRMATLPDVIGTGPDGYLYEISEQESAA